MAATLAKVGYGSLLKRGDGGGSEVFTAIAELLSFSFASSLDTVEATHMESLSSAKEFIAGMLDMGEVTAECNFLNDATQNLAAGVQLDMKNRTKRNWQLYVVSNTTDTISFTGFVTSVTRKASVNDKITLELKIKVTGLPTEA